MADWDVVGTAPAQVQNPWAVKSVAPVDKIGEANLKAQQSEQGPVQDTLDMLGHGATSAGRAALGLGNATLHPIDTLTHLAAALPGLIQHVTEAISNPAETAQHAGAVLSTMSGAEAGEKLGPLALGAGIGKGAGLLNDIAASAPAAAAPAAAAEASPAVVKFGLQTGEDHPIARNVAGASARPTMAAANQAKVDPALGAQAGVPLGTKITPQSLEAGRTAPDSVYQRAEKYIPTGPLSPAAAQTVQNVGADDMIVHSPDTQATIDAQKARLLSGPLTGSEVVNGQRALRFNGFRNVASEDPEQSALGQAQLKMADALHQHMVDTLPPDAPVSAEQLAAARVALAQNHTIESVLGPNGNVNLTKLAKIHNDNPGMLSGDMADIAQFASDHPEVTRLPSDAERFNPSGIIKDVASVNPLERPVGSVAQLFGGFLARRTLRGPQPTVTPKVTGLGGEFAPLDRRPPVAGPPGPPGAPSDVSFGGAFPANNGGITATPLTPKLGDTIKNQRGAVGAPTDIGGLRKLQNEPQTYGGKPAISASQPVTDKAVFNAYDEWQAGHPINDVLDRYAREGFPRDILEHELRVIKGLTEQPTSYSGVPLGKSFQ